MALNFRVLQDRLRRAIRLRIDQGQLTGLKLAQLTGFQQAHISNFLNERRGLSLEAIDEVMDACALSVVDLLQPSEVAQRAKLRPVDSEYDTLGLIESTIAASEPLIAQRHIRDTVKFKAAFLRHLRGDMATQRAQWERFVLIKLDAAEGLSMFPRLLPNALVLLDRHYNSLTPYRKHDRNMYAVRKAGSCTVKYVEISGSALVLRPHNSEYPVDIIPIENNKTYSDYIVGRVCHVSIEA